MLVWFIITCVTCKRESCNGAHDLEIKVALRVSCWISWEKRLIFLNPLMPSCIKYLGLKHRIYSHNTSQTMLFLCIQWEPNQYLNQYHKFFLLNSYHQSQQISIEKDCMGLILLFFYVTDKKIDKMEWMFSLWGKQKYYKMKISMQVCNTSPGVKRTLISWLVTTYNTTLLKYSP